jgi:uncharacterized protein YqgC (DUF456 family)
MDTTWLLFVLAAVLVVLGIVGLLLPVLPGAPLLLAGLVVAAWAEGFEKVGWPALVGIGALGLLASFVDFAAGAFGAKRFGASKAGMTGAVVGALLGLFFGLPGVLLGPLVGAIAGELIARRSPEAASRAGVGAALGLAIGAAAKVGLAFMMIGVFLVARFVE